MQSRISTSSANTTGMLNQESCLSLKGFKFIEKIIMPQIQTILISVLIMSLLFSCQEQVPENALINPVNDETKKEYANELEKIINENDIEKIEIIKPFGKTEITEQYDTRTHQFLFGQYAIAIDSVLIRLKWIDSFKIKKEKPTLVLWSNDAGTYYDRDINQEKMDWMRPLEDHYVYKDIGLIKHPLTGEKAPPIKKETLSGKLFDLEKLKGKPVYINFWYLRCSVCFEEIPEINQLKKGFPNVEFISIMPETKEKLAGKIERSPKGGFKHNRVTPRYGNEIDFDIIADAQSVIEAYKFQGYPISFFIGKDGRVKFVKRFERFRNMEESRVLLNELVN